MKKQSIERISFILFIFSMLITIAFSNKAVTGAIISHPEDPNPLVGLVFLAISLISAGIYFYIHLHHRSKK